MSRTWRLFSAALLPSLLFWPLLAGRAIFSYDTVNTFYVGKRWFFSELLHGRIPLWNEHVYMGFNSLSTPANGWLSPISAIFYLLIPSYWSEQLQLPVFAAFGAVGMFFWIRNLTRNESSAWLAALGFGLSGLLFSLPDRSHHFFALAFYPWAALCALRLIDKWRWGSLAGLAFSLAMIVVHADWTGALVIGLVLLLMAKSSSHAVRIAAAGFWGLSAAALAILPPLLDLSDTSRTGGFRFDQTSFYSLHPLRLLNLILPEAWGQPYGRNFFGQALANGYKAERFWFHSLYLGLPVLLLALRGWKSAWSGRAKFLTLFLLLCLLTSLGHHFFLHGLWYEVVPGYSRLRFPEKFVAYPLLGILTLAAVTAAQIENWKKILVSAAAIHAAAFLTYWLWPDFRTHLSMALPLSHLILAAGYAAASLRWPVTPAVGALLAAELILFSPTLNWGPAEELETSGPVVAKLKEGRVLRDSNLEATTDFRVRQTLQSNWEMIEKARSIFGYDTITPQRIERITGPLLFKNLESWVAVLNLTNILSTIQPRAPDLKRLAEAGFLQIGTIENSLNTVLLNVPRQSRDYIALCQHENVTSSEEAFQKVSERGNKIEPVLIEGAPADIPRAEASPTRCPAQVRVLSRTPEFRTYEVESETPAWLVERERFASGWRVFLDGQEAALYPADFLNRAVYIPAGKHKVEFRYWPNGLGIAAALSALAFLAFLTVLISQSLAHFRKTE